MALAIVHKLSNGSGTDASTYTTASVSVTAGDILWVVVTNASTVGTADALSGVVGTLGSTLTWTTSGSVLMNSSSRARTTIAWALCGSTTSGTLTFQFGGVTQASGQWTVLTTTGSDTTAPDVNVQTLRTAGADPSITLSPAPASTSAVIAAMHANQSTAGTAGTGYTIIGSGTAQTSPSAIQSTEQDTSAPSATVGFVMSGAVNKAMIAVEIQEPQTVNLAPDDSAHEHTSDSPGLTQVHVLAPDGTDDAHTTDSPALTQAHELAPADTANAHTSDSPALTQLHVLAPVDSDHAHAAESPTLTQVHLLAPADSFHGHTSTSPSLGGGATLTPDDSAHAHASESPTLTQVHMLVPADSFHAHSADVAGLTQVHMLAPLDTLNTHTSTSSSLGGTVPTPPERISTASTDPRASVALLEPRTSTASRAPRTSTSSAESRTSS